MLNFAYGSNLLEERLLARVPQARVVGVGRIAGWRLALNLRSEDGSAKANAIHTGRAGDCLHGAIYELDDAGKAALDGHEDVGGAYRIEHASAECNGQWLDVYLYAGNDSHRVEGLPPYDWYLGFILAGARQHALPADLIESLQAIRAMADPDAERSRRNWALIPEERTADRR